MTDEVLFIAEGASASSQQLILLAAIVLAAFFFMRMIRKSSPTDGSPKTYRRELDSAVEQNAAIRRDMEQLLIELDRFSRDVSAQIDTRFVKLEQSIADADKRISALRILLEAARAAGASLGQFPAADTPGPVDSPDTAHPQNTALSNASMEDSSTGSVRLSASQRRKQIYDLADQGLSPLQIAQKLDQRVGEVELILNLRGAAGGNR